MFQFNSYEDGALSLMVRYIAKTDSIACVFPYTQHMYRNILYNTTENKCNTAFVCEEMTKVQTRLYVK